MTSELESFLLVSSNIFEKIYADTKSNLSYNLPIVSTRGDFDLTNGKLIGYSPIAYKSSNIPGLQNDLCPEEPNKTAIYIHGYGVNGKTFASENALEIFSRVNMSLYKSLYNNNITLNIIGFNWDSDITNKEKGWEIAKYVAKNNGLKLAQFILDFKNNCPDADIRLIAHSLGSRVALSSIDILNNHPEWNDKNFTVKSVHLLAAAVDDEEISKNSFDIVKDPTNGYSMNVTEIKYPSLDKLKTSFGQAIEEEVGQFYNFYSPKDDSLEFSYKLNEKDNALGLTGAEDGISLPRNYNETDVQKELKPFCDADGHNSCDYPYNIVLNSIPSEGDNHFGYIGFRYANGTLKDDGAMDVVMKNWLSAE
jgi:hypothetical protein